MTQPAIAETPRAVRTATAEVHNVVKQRILDGHYRAREYVREASVARELGVSRTPVREALRELVSEGWLEAIPHHGARVVAWTERDAREVFELRLVLEPMAVRLASERMERTRLVYLETLANRMEALVERIEREPEMRNEIARLNHEFHRELIAASDNQRLAAVLDGVVRTSVIRRNFGNYDLANLRRSMRHHREILEAIAAGSPTWAESVMRSHLLAAQALHVRFPDAPDDPQALPG
ncbi:GntR family transcriptional regulator [Halomonas sp. MCCC 1A17488]|uniref:GntR family transcriptional regulator n=1 Tax=Billgrantia sulfidoxydans TaxID=2733484 RepID=A0ABX7W442_9GAMM|nr:MULTISPECIES: GntR family transcriptional regulator [Halomonas]MCE8015771.1 GntR family transcriptional regulator [Halomonas sp. MCCC 1A17488]MCG3239104.1 GntR family transcriptional regulator [Halomonas sp. MCCC 1A17488]QPP50952.1 GntR family transcriptional regulator [Halomonas sp. SS10-MC5]QTP54465.1 GntR family transcriptional regulator [Halomonas sulfidoxydans]